MSQETMSWLHNNCLIGFANKRGSAWWASRGADSTDDNGEPMHYDGPIPLDDVLRRLPAFNVEAISVPVTAVYEDANGNEVTLTDSSRQVIVRPDTKHILGVFKDGYVVHQYNEWLIGLASKLLDTSTSDLGIANVVTLKNGAVAAVQFEVPDTVTTKHGLEIRPSLLIVSSMDGSLATIPKRVVTNMVCDNTMKAGLSEKGPEARVKHTRNSLDKLDAMRAKLELEFIADEVSEEFNRLCETKVTGLQFKQFLTDYRLDKDGNDPLNSDETNGRARTLAENKQDKLMSMWLSDDRVSPWAGTAFGVLQLTNTYLQQVAPTNKGTIRYERNVLAAASGKIEQSDKLTLEILEKVLAAA